MFDKGILMKILPIIITLILQACALSPQTINILPDLSTVDIKPVNGKRLALNVRDSRVTRVVGYRGGIYNTAAISTQENVIIPIYTKLSHTLENQGFTVVDRGTTAAASLEVDLKKLSYIVKQQKIPWKVEVSAVISAKATAGTKTVSSNFEDSLNKDFAKSPAPGENEKLINNVISKLLQRILQDESIAGIIR